MAEYHRELFYSDERWPRLCELIRDLVGKVNARPWLGNPPRSRMIVSVNVEPSGKDQALVATMIAAVPTDRVPRFHAVQSDGSLHVQSSDEIDFNELDFGTLVHST